MKPFRPPTIVGRSGTGPSTSPHTNEPPQKKRRIGSQDDDDDTASIAAAAKYLKRPERVSLFQPPVRKPLVDVQNVRSSQPSDSGRDSSSTYYTVLW